MIINYVDQARSVVLTDAGLADYLAATVIDEDGGEHLVPADFRVIGEPNVLYDASCATAVHEQLGPLPIDYVRRMAISQRTHRPDDTHPKETP